MTVETKSGGLSTSIFGRILWMMVVVAAIPLGGLVYLSGYAHQRDWRENVDQSLLLTANALGARVDGWLDGNLRALRDNAALPDILSMETERQQAALKALQRAYEWTYLVFTVAPDGRNVGRSDEKPLTFYGDRNYFRQVIEGRAVGQEVLIGRTSGKPALILAQAIAGHGGAAAGVLAMAMNLVDVSDAVVGTRIGKSGYAILVDEQRKAIAHGNPAAVSTALQDLSTHPVLRTGSEFVPVVFNENGHRVVGVTKRLSLGWTLIVLQDYDEAFAPLIASRTQALILVGVALLLVVVVALALARQLAGPIAGLTRAAEEISRGNFESTIVGTDRRDEIGALARAVERMALSIRMAFDRLKKKA